MNANTRRLALTGVALLIALLMLLTAWIVGARPAQATADYIRKDCAVLVSARLSTTAWQTGPSTSNLHVDLNSYLPAAPALRLTQDSIQIDGVTYFTGVAGTNDRNVSINYTVAHTVRGWWRGSDGRDYSCSVSYAAGTAR
jgi:hypothetical protein